MNFDCGLDLVKFKISHFTTVVRVSERSGGGALTGPDPDELLVMLEPEPRAEVKSVKRQPSKREETREN